MTNCLLGRARHHPVWELPRLPDWKRRDLNSDLPDQHGSDRLRGSVCGPYGHSGVLRRVFVGVCENDGSGLSRPFHATLIELPQTTSKQPTAAAHIWLLFYLLNISFHVKTRPHGRGLVFQLLGHLSAAASVLCFE